MRKEQKVRNGQIPAHLSTFNQELSGSWAPAGVILGCEKAGYNLEGGLSNILEGLRDSSRPCETCLSVAGFFAHLRLFLLRKEVYSQGEEVFFPPGEPSLLQLRD